MPSEAEPVASTTQTGKELQRQASTWLALSLVSSVACLSLALGVGGAIFCHLAMQAAAQGLHADAAAKLKWGQILTVVGSALGAVTVVLTLLLR